MVADEIRMLALDLSSAQSVVIVSGAGISAESGIPLASELIESCPNFSTYEGFKSDPAAAWRFYDDVRCQIAKAQPSAAHVALVRLQELLGSFLLATHNVDRLHQTAGSKNVLELSGNIWELRCENEGRVSENYSTPLAPLPPRCSCGAILRPNVVFSGEDLVAGAYGFLRNIIAKCQGIVLFVGISGRNTTVYSLIENLKIRGWKIVEVNPKLTLVSQSADVLIRRNACDVFPPLVQLLPSLG